MDEDSIDPVQPEDELGDEAEGLGMSLSGFARWTGGMLVALGLVLASWFGPGWYLDAREEAFDACLEASPAERDRPPISCLSHIESARWLSYAPWVSGAYGELLDVSRKDAHATQLRYVSTVEPSADKRAETLDQAADLAERLGPVDLAYSEPDSSRAGQFLNGIDEFVETNRTRHARWSLVNRDGAVSLERAIDLARFTADETLQASLVDRGVEAFGDGPLDCQRCSEVFELAVMACRIGRTEASMRLAERYAEVDRLEDIESRLQWDQYSASERELAREAARNRNRKATRDTRQLRALCSEQTDTTLEVDGTEVDLMRWWETDTGRSLVRRHAAVADPLVRLAAIAHKLGSSDIGPEGLEAYIRDLMEADPTDDRDELIERVSTQYTLHVAYRTSLSNYWGPPVALPEVYDEAVSQLADQFDLEANAAADKLARSLRMASAHAAVKTGQPARAVEILDSITNWDRAPRRRFRTAIYRLTGHPGRAAELFGEQIAEETNDPDHRRRLTLRRVSTLAAAGEREAARRVYSDLSNTRQGEVDLQSSLARYAGIGYTLAFLDERPAEEAIRQLVPADLQPDSLDNVDFALRADALRYAYRLQTASGTERKWLRNEPEDTLTDRVWYQAALGVSVESPYDPEVFLDFVVGTGRTPFTAWRRAEAARWRGDREAAEAWTERLFASREHLDDTQSILLEALL